MSKFGCVCGHIMPDQTDFLPYKAYLREDEDTQKPIEMLADILAQFWSARESGQEVEFLRDFERSRGESDAWADWLVQHLADQPLSATLYNLIFGLWNNYDRVIYECEACGRLWIEMENNHFVSYTPESSTRQVLWSRHNHNPYGYLEE